MRIIPRLSAATTAMLLAGTMLLATPAITRAADGEFGQPMAIPTPLPDIPSVHPSASFGGLASAPALPMPNYSPAANLGPVTGYGPGGMSAMPGAPANPPYSGGGLGGRR